MIKREQAYTAKKCMNIIDKISRDKNENFIISIKENVFMYWKNIIVNKKRHAQRIA